MTRDEAIDLAFGRYERELEKSGVGYTSLYAFLASLAASGYAVVPVEATEEMCDALMDNLEAICYLGTGQVIYRNAPECWRAMLAATEDYSLPQKLSASLTREAKLRAELTNALNDLATEKTLREHETRRANDNYASLKKHWLNESRLRELLTEIVEYKGGADHALADEYVVARIKEKLKV